MPGKGQHFLRALLKNHDEFVLDAGDRPIATAVETAFDSASRKRGLLGRDGLPDGAAMIIAPCSAVHTFGMRFAIDVIFAGADGRVLKVRPSLAPARMAGALGAFATIEMAAGAVERTGLKVGDVLVVRKKETAGTQEPRPADLPSKTI